MDASAVADAAEASAPGQVTCTPGPTEGKAANCAHTADLGAEFVNGFGRADGLVRAVVPPSETHCETSCNPSHLTIEVDIRGKAHRLVVTMVDTKSADHKMFFAERDAPLVGGAWAEGWHQAADVKLDYPTALGLHGTDFVSFDRDVLAGKVSEQIQVGDKISVFATCQTDKFRAHLVHRNGAYADGAVVVHPDTAPHYLAFYYLQNQNF